MILNESTIRLWNMTKLTTSIDDFDENEEDVGCLVELCHHQLPTHNEDLDDDHDDKFDDDLDENDEDWGLFGRPLSSPKAPTDHDDGQIDYLDENDEDVGLLGRLLSSPFVFVNLCLCIR